jgi:hypothetical protein
VTDWRVVHQDDNSVTRAAWLDKEQFCAEFPELADKWDELIKPPVDKPPPEAV